jgi:hypothetical protein
LIDRSSTIIENSDLIEKNYIKLLNIANGRTDQKQKIDEMHSLNEENLRTILKLRKELICIKKSQQHVVPNLQLEKLDRENARPNSMNPPSEYESQSLRNSTSPLRASKNMDSFFSKKLQEAEKKIERYTELLTEKEKINQALENEIMRKDDALRKMQSTIESSYDKEHSERHELNNQLYKQRKDYEETIESMNEELERK